MTAKKTKKTEEAGIREVAFTPPVMKVTGGYMAIGFDEYDNVVTDYDYDSPEAAVSKLCARADSSMRMGSIRVFELGPVQS